MRLQSGMLFHGRYRLAKSLGQGASAQVWMAFDTMANDLKVAVKILSAIKNIDTFGIQNFVREFTYVFNLQHQNLLTPSSYNICEGTPYLVLPFCENGSATSMVGRADKNDVIKFLHDVAAALDCLHTHHIVHQDIKPDNILLDDDCNFLVTDFGISTQAVGHSSPTSGSFGGTRGYMGPERFEKDSTAINMNDIWALGATAYELVTGNAPFGDNGGMVQAMGEPIPDLPDSLDPELRKLIIQCLDPEPWNRPKAEEIKRKTEIYLETGKWERPSGKKYLLWGIAAAASILLVVGLFVFDYNRTKVFYYKDYVERWGVPEGIGRLSGSEARHSHRMYKFEVSKGKVRKVSHVNSLDKIIFDGESERNERPLCQEIFYTSEGNVSRIRVKDNNEKTLYVKSFNENLRTMAFQFDDEHNTERTLAAQTVGYGRILEDVSTEQRGRISRWWIEYDKNGWATKIEYAGLDNSKVGDVNNIYGRTLTHDEKGRVIKICYFGKDGEPKGTKWGLGIKTFEFDEEDNWIRSTYLSTTGAPSFDDFDGVSIFEQEYDDIGNLIAAYHKDGEGQLMLPKKNEYAGVSYEYDDKGFIVKAIQLGVNKEPIYVSKEGYSSYVAKCDENGFFSEQIYLDPSDEPCNNSMGINKLVMKCDERGNELERWHYDVNGNLCLDKNGIAGYKCKYDSLGNMAEIVFCGTDKKPTLTSNGIAGWKRIYDDRDLVLEEMNIGTDLKPSYNSNNVCVARYEYDKRGNMTKIAFYSAEGTKLVESNEGIAGWVSSYDELGNEIERKFFNNKDESCLVNGEYASKKSKYDGNGNMTSTYYYGLSDQLISVNGVAGYEYKYDARGNETERIPMGANGHQASGKLSQKCKYDAQDNLIMISYYSGGKSSTDKDGVHRYEYTYNAQHKRIGVKCFDSKDKLTIDKSVGAAIEKDEYDNRGNRVKCFYYGIDEKPIKGKEGWASSTYEYNAMGLVIRQCFFGVDGKPTDPSVMVPIGICEYDKWGNMTYLAAQDKNGKFIINKNTGWAISRMEYNDRSEILSQAYYDAEDKPMLGNEGCHRIRYKYNNSGKRTELAVYGKSDEPMLVYGFHKRIWKYDEKGRLTEETIYNTKGKPVDGKRSYFKCVTTYYNDGQPKTEKYYKANGSLLASRNYNRNTGQWGSFTGTTVQQSNDVTGGSWQENVKALGQQCPADVDGGIRILSVICQDNTVVMRIKNKNASKDDINVNELTENITGVKQDFRKLIGLPLEVHFIIEVVDKDGEMVLRL